MLPPPALRLIIWRVTATVPENPANSFELPFLWWSVRDISGKSRLAEF